MSLITGLFLLAESTVGQLYVEREPPTTEVGWAGQGTLTALRGREGGEGGGKIEREGGRKKHVGTFAWAMDIKSHENCQRYSMQ